MHLERDLFADELVSAGSLYVYHTNNFWSQIKNAGQVHTHIVTETISNSVSLELQAAFTYCSVLLHVDIIQFEHFGLVQWFNFTAKITFKRIVLLVIVGAWVSELLCL